MSARSSARPPRPLILGVLGGVASGKSEVARRLAGDRGVLIRADDLAQEALDDPALAPQLVEAFGAEVLDEDGRPRREALAERVFADPEGRQLLEGWIHPIVRARIGDALAEAEATDAERVVLDIPLLLENDTEHGLAARCHTLVFVDAPPAQREQRGSLHRGWSAGEVTRREAAQLSLSHKRERADFVINNAGTPADLDRAVDQLLVQLGLS